MCPNAGINCGRWSIKYKHFSFKGPQNRLLVEKNEILLQAMEIPPSHFNIDSQC